VGMKKGGRLQKPVPVLEEAPIFNIQEETLINGCRLEEKMFRVCPKCHKTVKSNSALFCYHCGAELNLPNEQVVEDTPAQKNPQKETKSALLKIAVLILSLALLSIGGYFGYTKFKPSKNNEIVSPVDLTTSQKFEVDLSDLDVKLSSGELNAKELSQIAPVGIDLFIILRNPNNFYENFVEENSKVDIPQLTGLSVEEAASFLESSFAIAVRENSWAFIAKTKNKDFLETKLTEIDTKNLDYEVGLAGDFLIITNDVNMLNEVGNIEKGASLSLDKDAFFVEATKNLPREGAALVFYRDVNSLTPFLEKIGRKEGIETKGKNGFAAIKSGKGVLLQF